MDGGDDMAANQDGSQSPLLCWHLAAKLPRAAIARGPRREAMKHRYLESLYQSPGSR